MARTQGSTSWEGRTPRFEMLENERPSSQSVLLAIVLASICLFAGGIMIQQGAKMRKSISRSGRAENPSVATPKNLAAPIYNSVEPGTLPAKTVPRSNDKTNSPQISKEPVSPTAVLDDTERRLVISRAINLLEYHYSDDNASRRMAQSLLERENDGGYRSLTSSQAFATYLTWQLREESHDQRLAIHSIDSGVVDEARTGGSIYRVDDHFSMSMPRNEATGP